MSEDRELRKRAWRELLLEGLWDHHGLWWICRYFDQATDSQRGRRQTLQFVRELLESGQFEAGFPTPDGRGFKPWALQPAEAVAKIESDWIALGKVPDIGDVVWLNLTQAGKDEAEKLEGSVPRGSA